MASTHPDDVSRQAMKELETLLRNDVQRISIDPAHKINFDIEYYDIPSVTILFSRFSRYLTKIYRTTKVKLVSESGKQKLCELILEINKIMLDFLTPFGLPKNNQFVENQPGTPNVDHLLTLSNNAFTVLMQQEIYAIQRKISDQDNMGHVLKNVPKNSTAVQNKGNMVLSNVPKNSTNVPNKGIIFPFIPGRNSAASLKRLAGESVSDLVKFCHPESNFPKRPHLDYSIGQAEDLTVNKQDGIAIPTIIRPRNKPDFAQQNNFILNRTLNQNAPLDLKINNSKVIIMNQTPCTQTMPSVSVNLPPRQDVLQVKEVNETNQENDVKGQSQHISNVMVPNDPRLINPPIYNTPLGGSFNPTYGPVPPPYMGSNMMQFGAGTQYPAGIPFSVGTQYPAGMPFPVGTPFHPAFGPNPWLMETYRNRMPFISGIPHNSPYRLPPPSYGSRLHTPQTNMPDFANPNNAGFIPIPQQLMGYNYNFPDLRRPPPPYPVTTTFGSASGSKY